MNEKNSISDYEIDLFEILKILWNGKWKIVSFVVVSLISVFLIRQFEPPPTLTAITEVKPITSGEYNTYQSLNEFDFFVVSRQLLLDLYIEKLDEKKIFEQVMEEYSFIDFEIYNDEQIYKQDIRKLASKIKIKKTIPSDAKKDELSNLNWTIEFDINDEKIWKKILMKVDSSINLSIKNDLIESFKTKIFVAEQTRKFAIQDIEIQISNAKKNYDTLTFNRVKFLTEQAKIARKLGIPKNTFDIATYSGVITNFNRSTPPYYLNGYESIEMEIDLMTSRNNKESFIEELPLLEEKKRRLIQNKTIDRANEIFNMTFDNNNFSAASINVDSIVITSRNNYILIIITILISGIISALYVFISTLSKRQK